MSRSAPRIIAATVASIGLGAGVLVAGTVPASANSGARVNDCGTLAIKPTELVLACADANQMLTDLTWSGWSAGQATGKGRYEVNDCEPTCVAGTARSYPVRVQLKTPKAQSGVRVFTRVVLSFTKKTPTGKKTMRLTLARYAPQTKTPPAESPSSAPSASPAPEVAANPSPTPSATPSATPTPTPTATASPNATPTPSPSATTAAIAPPKVTIESRRRVAGGSVKYILSASSKARGGNFGITAVTGYQANEYGAELTTRGTYMGYDYGSGTSWEVTFSCATNRGDDVRLVIKAADGQTTTIREKRPC